MISKELLKAVMPIYITVESSGSFTSEEGFAGITFKASFVDGFGNKGIHSEIINIYELAHKCKEWANHQGRRGYTIESKVSETLGQARAVWTEKGHTDYHGNPREFTFNSEWFRSDNNNEPEAIFKACQWILDNKETK